MIGIGIHHTDRRTYGLSLDSVSVTTSTLRSRIAGVYVLLVGGNLAAWAWAIAAFHRQPLLLGTAFIAYSLGLRHAVDADHIAAIDNVTRRLMQDGQRPVGVGLYFSLGHSTVVVLASVAIAATATAFQTRFAALQNVGSVIGTTVSAVFLFVIALLNLLVLISLWRVLSDARAGRGLTPLDSEALIAGAGIFTRFLRPLFQMIGHSWQMYPLGFLFGLGFDTATEIALLGISAAGGSHGMSIWSILVFPALFVAGMSLVDTTDGILMLGAYGWAFVRPLRKLYYNVTITLMSVVVAVGVGGIETLGLIGHELHLSGGVWTAVNTLNEHFGVVGVATVGLFIGGWALSVLLYRALGVEKWDDAASSDPSEVMVDARLAPAGPIGDA
jgi:nickel/cobalt transporter (NiCoT) family protein